MGNFSGTFTPDNSSIKDRHISGVLGDRISADKVQPFFKIGSDLGVAVNGTPVTKSIIRHVASQAGSVRGFHALLVNVGTSTSVSFDLQKNGATILTTPIVITNANSNYQIVDGVLASTLAATLAANDILTIVVTATSTTGALGPYCWFVVDEQNTSQS